MEEVVGSIPTRSTKYFTSVNLNNQIVFAYYPW